MDGVSQATKLAVPVKKTAKLATTNQSVLKRVVKARMANAHRARKKTAIVRSRNALMVMISLFAAILIAVGPNGKWKDCPCFNPLRAPRPNELFSEQELIDQDVFIDALPSKSGDTGQPAATPTCWPNNVKSVPSQVVETNGNVDPNTLLYTLRQVICSNSCDKPANLPDGVAWASGSKTTGDCELAVAMPDNVEAYMYRGTPSTGVQWQQCWNSTQAIIETCVKNGPNKGWANGPNDFEFFEGGFRPLNDQGAIHKPMSNQPLSTPTPTGGSDPTKPSQAACYSGKVSAPFISFKESEVQAPIRKFCDYYVSQYPYTIDQEENLDPTVPWYKSKYLVEMAVVVPKGCSKPNDLANQCTFALTQAVYNCDWGSGEKWGGTNVWNCLMYKINGNSGTTSTSWDGK
ncbi:MAG: hypothetical protein M1840_000963 [Geoglossum simile]|nr:MAG: hypothetical protein M1840_000963 [Geoglossum simile]